MGDEVSMSEERLSRIVRSGTLKLALPVIVTVALYTSAFFLLFIPSLERSVMERKREEARNLVKTVLSLLSHLHGEVELGRTTREDAQKEAIGILQDLRFGPEQKDYFWVNDMHPRMVMHPYRSDLNGRDIGDFADPNGTELFSRAVEVVKEEGGGWVPYLWQWQDDPERIVRKLSYVHAFEPWGWIVGTGIYVDDVRSEVANAVRMLFWASLTILVVIVALGAFVLWQGLRSERARLRAVEALRDLNEDLEGRVARRTQELEAASVELAHARKLEAVGQLAAGIAHEINTPVQFVGDSVHFLREAYEDQRALLRSYERVLPALEAGDAPGRVAQEIREAAEEADLAYLDEHVPSSFDRCTEGLGRIATIVGAMKEFAHPDQRQKSAGDINAALKATLAIAKNEYKYVADVETEFGELPPVMCYLGDLNQVFLNLIVNAAHAIGDVVAGRDERGRIIVRTSVCGDSVCIEIQDSGAGIPTGIRDRVFEPFFTTKEVGRGSGQGLAIAHAIVTEKHGGRLTFTSEERRGTTFRIDLPISGGGEAGA